MPFVLDATGKACTLAYRNGLDLKLAAVLTQLCARMEQIGGACCTVARKESVR